MFSRLIVALCIFCSFVTFSKNTKRKEVSKETKANIIRVLKANENLHASFFKYDAALVEKNALALKAEVEKIKNKEISKLLNYAKKKLANIKASNKRETNNMNYHVVSMGLIVIINKYDLGKKYNSYTCPMIKKKWVQNTDKMKKVHNPYAPEMPHCGSQSSKY